jgi:antitoxin component of MazEF toxin-antitoxin module
MIFGIMIPLGATVMTTQIVRVGNTLSVEIPEELAAQASLPVGEPMEWVANGSGSITLVKRSGTASAVPYREITVEELLEGIEDGTSLGEYDWGPPRGVEVW